MIVDLHPSEEQQLIEDSVTALLRQKLPVERLRDPASHGGAAERAAWRDFAELGLFGLGLAEDLGGVGLGPAEEALAGRALGRHLASPCLVAQMIAPHFAEDADLRALLVAGSRRAAFANMLSPGKAQLIDAQEAEWLVLFGQGAALVPASAASKGVAGLDETLCLAHADMKETMTARGPGALRASLLLAAYLTGIAEASQALAVDYAKTREQFGQPIGAFQAIKHSCADMAVRSAAAAAQVFHAAIILGRGGDDEAEVAAARLLAADAALGNAKANLQIHGGMGFTAECDAHLFLKRAHVIAMLGSSRRAEQARLLPARQI
jgi:alkylation response protein AidB-like acyl-CoA dehydrogenase